MTTGQDNSGMVRNINPILSKVLGRNSLDVDKSPEVNFQTVLFRKIVIRRFL